MIKIAVFDLEESFWHRKKVFYESSPENISVEYYYLFASDKEKVKENAIRLEKPYRIDADILVVYGYRIPDHIVIQKTTAKKIFYIQHGYYTSRMSRTLDSVFKKADRVSVYFQMLVHGYLAGTLSEKKSLRSLLKFWIFGKSISNGNDICPDTCLILGEYWQNFHSDKLGWSNSDYKVLPSYESKKIVPKPNYSKINYQYVCQSLVEDGRISSADLCESLNQYFEANQIEEIYFIQHPRTNKSVYADVGAKIIFVESHLYDIDTLGHYSSLLLYAKFCELGVFLIGLINHDIPEDFIELVELDIDECKSFFNYTQHLSESDILSELLK